MTIPLIVLAVLAVGSGLFNITGGFSSFFGAGETHSVIQGLFGIFADPLPWISLILAGSGIFLAYAIYSRKWISAESLGKIFSPLYKLFYHKYWVDELYEGIIVKKVLMGGLFKAAHFFDSKILDGGINTFMIQKVIVRNFFAGLFAFDKQGCGRRSKRRGRHDTGCRQNNTESTDWTITILRLGHWIGYYCLNCQCVYI